MNRKRTRSALARLACGFADASARASSSSMAASAKAPNPPPARSRNSRRERSVGICLLTVRPLVLRQAEGACVASRRLRLAAKQSNLTQTLIHKQELVQVQHR